MRQPKILVTGATGRTGSAVVDGLLAKDIPVRAVVHDLPWRLFLKAARTANVGAFLVSNLRYYVEDHNQGAFALDAPTNDVLEVTGRPAEDFETTARRYATQPEAQRNFTNWLRTFVNFMRTPLVPGYNPERLDRELLFPEPPAPRLAMANEGWKVEHGTQFAQLLIAEPPAVQRTLVQGSA